MNHYIHTLCIFFIILTGCDSSPKKIYDRYEEFQETIPLTAQEILLDSADLRYPFRIAIQENIAIILDLHGPDHYLHAYSLPEWTHLNSFVPRGDGPAEMVVCETFQFNSLDSLWAMDPNKMVIHRYEINSGEKDVKLAEIIPISRELIRSLDLMVTDTGFIVPDYTGKHRYHLLNREGNIGESGGFIPQESGLKANIALANGWRPFMDYNEKKGILAVATQLGEVLEIYSLKGDSTHIIKYGPNEEPEFIEIDGHGMPDGIKGFNDIQVTDQYIYAIFEGRDMKESFDEFLKTGNHSPGGGKQVYVFDFEGNPVKKYLLDHHIQSLYVNEKGGYFYALDINQDNPVLKYSF